MSRTHPTPISAASTVCPALTPDADASPVAQSIPDQIALLARCADQLWRTEPDVAPSQRSRLLERLARLENDIVRMSLQHEAGGEIDGRLLLTCHAEADELRWWWRPTGRDGGRRAA